MPRKARFAKSKKSTKGSRKVKALIARGASAARKGRPKIAGMSANGVFDILEKIANVLPNIVKTGRGFFGGPQTASAAAGIGNIESETVFQTPASFAVIRNNTTSASPEMRVDHAEKGISGIRRTFTQPFNGVNLAISGGPMSYFWDASVVPQAQWLDDSTIPINPLLLRGPCAQFAALYDRYVIRRFRLRFTSVQSTTFLGAMAVCIEKDVGNLSANTDLEARMVVPCITAPYRVPTSELFWEYNGPELYYVNSTALNTPATLLPAEARQDIQFVVKGFDIGHLATPTVGSVQCSFCDIEVEIDFFDPISPSELVGGSLEEQLVHREVRSLYRNKETKDRTIDVEGAAANEKEFRGRVSNLVRPLLDLPVHLAGRVERPPENALPYAPQPLPALSASDTAMLSELLAISRRQAEVRVQNSTTCKGSNKDP